MRCGGRLGGLALCLGLLSVFAWAVRATPGPISPRDALWIIVHDECVTDQEKNHDPRPCERVDLDGGVEKGFAVLKDLRGSTQYLVLPTANISGIESPVLLSPDTPNYFADAWEARAYVDEAVKQPLPRDAVGFAINSLASRSQDQLHIHVDCMRTDVREALRANVESLHGQWALMDVPLAGRRYQAMWVPGKVLGSHSPFRMLAEGIPGAQQEMANWTLVAVGSNRADGTPGFILLADRVDREQHDAAHGEDLLDHACRIAEPKPVPSE